MESLASISGLATGIDFRALVDQIIEVESSRLDYLRVQISEDQAKKTAWNDAKALLQAVQDSSARLSDGSGLNVFTTDVLGANPDILSVTASEDASEGRHTVRILQAAQRESVGSSLQTTKNTALGLDGQFVLGGRIIDVASEDSLVSLATRINEQNFGADPIGVTASVVGSDGAYRLVLSADDTGAEGLGLLDIDGVLGSLGFVGDGAILKNRTSGGFESDAFAASTTAVGSLLGFTSGAPSGVVTLGSGASAFTVSLDLGSQSLESVRDSINAAAAGAGSSMFATIEADGTGYRLSVTGTAAATDADGVLQALGILEADTGAIAQVVQGDVLTTDAGGTLATASTALTALYNGASPAGAQVGDTILFEGTDDVGAAFSFTHTIQAGDTLQTLITRLEGAEGFNGSATVEVDADGRLSVTSAAPGASLLSLAAFAGNEGGGILDLGDFAVTAEGRFRQISEGRDALVEIDGALVRSDTNEIDDVVSGLTFNVLGADPFNTLDVIVGRDAPAGVEAIQEFVGAVNALIEFVSDGIGIISEDRPPLAGDAILRGVRDRINFALQSTIPVGATGSVRLADLGLEITRSGTYTLDTAVLTAALTDDPLSVQRAFGSYGAGTTAALAYVGATSATTPGSYEVSISQAAARAEITSVGFGGVYVDDGTADTMTITDIASSAQYQIALSNGMSLVQMIDALNTEFDREIDQVVTSERTMYSDAGASTQATASTTLDSLYHGAGQSSGFIAGTEVTISGTAPNGSSVLSTFSVTDPATQTLGQLRAAVESAFGSGVSVSITNGQLVVADQGGGSSQLAVTIGADIAGNAAPFGQMQVTTTGRANAGIVAEDVGGQLRIRSSSYGADQSFSVSYAAGGSSGVGSLGLAAGTYQGAHVVGTIGGEAATGVGNILTADAGTTAEGLAVQVSGTTTGLLGEVSFGRGIMSSIEDVADVLLGTEDGSIADIIERLDENVDRVEDRLFDREARLEARREQLLRQFVSLEQAIARAQSQQQWIQAQISSLPSGADSS